MQRSMANARIFRIPQKYCNRNKPLFFLAKTSIFLLSYARFPWSVQTQKMRAVKLKKSYLWSFELGDGVKLVLPLKAEAGRLQTISECGYTITRLSRP